MMNLKQSIGMRVKVARLAAKLSQELLSEHIERSTETVSNIERGVTVPNIETLQRLSRVLDIPLAEFFEQDGYADHDRKRLRVEIEIRQSLKKLNVPGLEVVRLQVEALVDRMDVLGKSD